MSVRERDFFVVGREMYALKFYLKFNAFKPELRERANKMKNQITIFCDNIKSGEITDLILIKRLKEEFIAQFMRLRRDNNMP